MLMQVRRAVKAVPGARRAAQLFRYVMLQTQLRRAEAEDRASVPDPGSIPLPPAHLRYRVHGDLSRDSFLRVGAQVANDIRRIVAASGREWSAFQNILDFGSGSGRVIRNLIRTGDGANYFGTDIDAELVEWCRKSIHGVDWRSNPFMPPSDFNDGMFDFVYGISVFTHLDESYQLAWLEELYRITKQDAMLVLTVHGDFVIGQAALTATQRSTLESKGFLFIKGATGRLKLDGLPDFYQTSYQTADYIKNTWGQYFEVIRHIPRGVNSHQDAVVLRRP